MAMPQHKRIMGSITSKGGKDQQTASSPDGHLVIQIMVILIGCMKIGIIEQDRTEQIGSKICDGEGFDEPGTFRGCVL